MSPVSDRFFSLVPDRQCDECMVCCEYLSINSPAFRKPAEVLCNNCVVDQGCSIYETRPAVCRTWHCLWRRDETIPLELRPDKSGVIFSLKVCYESMQVFENAYIVCMAMKNPASFDVPLVSATLDKFVNEGSLPVWLSFGGGKNLAWPDADLANAIISPRTARSSELADRGKVWLERYESMLEALQAQNAKFNNRFAFA